MITELTQEQIDLMPVIRDKWIDIGLSTRQCSKEEGEAAVAEAYRCAKLEPPKEIVWAKNPVEACLLVASAWASVRASVWVSVWYFVGASVRNRIDTYFWSDDWSFLDYFKSTNIVDGSLTRGIFECSKCFSWWWAFDDVAVVVRKPLVLHKSDDGLHCEDGPAIKWDGFEVWCLDGYRVPKNLVLNPKEQTLDEIDSEGNEEIKRIRIERYGWEKYLTESDA